MAKKGLIVLILAALVAGGVFAQSDFSSMAKNTITVDLGPTIIGAAFGAMGSMMGDSDINTSGFGIGGQYERQILKNLSAAARFAYLGAGLGVADGDGTARVELEMNLKSFSVEGHVRFYPLGETFFLDGLLGYANLSTGFSGEVRISDSGFSHTEKASLTASRSYLKLGAKLGWRKSFGRNGGFTFEPSFGYSYGIGLGDSIPKQLFDDVGGEVDEVDQLYKYIESIVFIGGPRVSLAFGYRF